MWGLPGDHYCEFPLLDIGEFLTGMRVPARRSACWKYHPHDDAFATQRDVGLNQRRARDRRSRWGILCQNDAAESQKHEATNGAEPFASLHHNPR